MAEMVTLVGFWCEVLASSPDNTGIYNGLSLSLSLCVCVCVCVHVCMCVRACVCVC